MKNILEKIEAWIAKPVYWDGVELYILYGENQRLKDYLKAGSEEYRKKLLTSEIIKIKESLSAKLEEERIDAPAIISENVKRAKSLMDNRSALKERARLLYLKGITEGEELHDIAHTIVSEINPQLDEISGIESFWKANKFIPESPEVAVSNIADLLKRRNNLRTYISRGTQDPSKLASWQSELLELDNKIRAIQHN